MALIKKSNVLAITLCLPREPFIYPLYLIATVLLFRITVSRQAITILFALIAYLFISIVINSFFYDISISTFLIQLMFLAPLCLFLSGSNCRLTPERAIHCLRLLNLSVFILSFLHMAIYWDFPFKLPYVHYLPDQFSAFFWIGGAKIVTLIGGFGLLAELYLKQTDQKNLTFLAICAANLIIPSYILGIVAVIAAIALVRAKPVPLLISGSVLLLIYFGSEGSRIHLLTDRWDASFGMNPKLFAVYHASSYISKDFVTLFLGTGIGQFGSEAAIWASPYFSETSRGNAALAFLQPSEHHIVAFEDIYRVWANNFWVVSSSASKPYSGLSNLLAETGIIGFVLCVGLLVWRFKRFLLDTKRPTTRTYARSVILCAFLLNGVDSWFEQPWFVALLLLSTSIFSYQYQVSELG